MKLYWSPRSPFVRKVMVCAHELGIAERIEKAYALVSSRSANAEVMQTSPLGRIPALEADEGVVLYDSAVICEYLDHRFGGARLFPRNSTRWDVLRRHALADGLLEILVRWLDERNRPAERQSAETLAAHAAKVQAGLAAADRDVAARTGEPDIADITLGVVLGYLDFRYPDLQWRARHTALARWFEVFGERPSMVATAPHDELAGG
jgi:glutathione S-transferase